VHADPFDRTARYFTVNYQLQELLMIRLALQFAAIAILLNTCGVSAADARNDASGEIAFSVKQWKGDYVTSDKDVSKNTSCSGGIWTADLRSGAVRKLVDVGGLTANPIFSRDGQWLYFQSNGTGAYEIYRCRPDGSAVQNLTGPQNAKHEFWSYGFSISADGRKILHTIHNGRVAQIAIMNADGSDRHPIDVPGVKYFYMGALSPDSQRIVFANVATDYSLMIADLASGKSRLLDKGSPQVRCIVPQFTSDGNRILYLKTDGDIYSVGADGSRLKQLTHGDRYNTLYLSATDEHGSSDPPSLSPDNKHVAFIARQDGVPQVFTMNLEGSDRRQITFRASACGRAKWSPDGRQLAFVSFEGRYPQLFIVSANGGEPRKLTNLPAAVYFLNWRPNLP
jgi:Tol biopolymer transport system component